MRDRATPTPAKHRFKSAHGEGAVVSKGNIEDGDGRLCEGTVLQITTERTIREVAPNDASVLVSPSLSSIVVQVRLLGQREVWSV